MRWVLASTAGTLSYYLPERRRFCDQALLDVTSFDGLVSVGSSLLVLPDNRSAVPPLAELIWLSPE